MRALVIEDDDANRKLLEIFLAPHGTCHVSSNGNDGIAKFEEALRTQPGYDLVVLDIMMPGMDGVEVLKRIRQLEDENGIPTPEKAKVLMMTAVADKEIVISSFREGCQAYLIKPLDREELIRQLKNLKVVA